MPNLAGGRNAHVESDEEEFFGSGEYAHENHEKISEVEGIEALANQ
jgi:hypothetical protein